MHEYAVICTTRFYTGRRYKATSAKEKACGWNVEETGCKLPRVLSCEITQCMFYSPSCDNTCEVWSSGKFIRDAMPRGSVGGLSRRHALPSTYQKARVPEGRQLLIINHTVYTDNLGKSSHSYQGGRNAPQIQVPTYLLSYAKGMSSQPWWCTRITYKSQGKSVAEQKQEEHVCSCPYMCVPDLS